MGVCATTGRVSLESVERGRTETEEMGAKEGTNQIEVSVKGRAPRCSLALGEHFGNVKRRYQRGSCKRDSRLRVRLYGLHEVP